ncbi:MAG: porin [Sandaracinaceae bacterium]|nr:porin [Sandaracinaceae bacterium]
MRATIGTVLLILLASPLTAQPPETVPETETEIAPGPVPETVPESEPEPVPVPETAPAPAPAPAAETRPEPEVRFTAEPGRGFTLRVGDAFSANLQPRIQLRYALHVTDDDGDADRSPELAHEIQIRTLRLWFRGHVLDPDVRYGIQLALGANDFEAGNASPVFDAYVDVTELRDLSFRIGQFFVPFDRARTIREFALQSVDRAEAIRELTLDRDMGLAIYSDDLFGLGGRLAYQLGLFGGDGRNRFGGRELGLLYTARAMVRPFGSFDDDREGDTARTAEPRLAIGAAFAFNHQTDRPRSTTGAPYDGGTFDYLHFASDLVFKWRGFYLLAEIVWRQATLPSRNVIFPDGTAGTIFARDGWGAVIQSSMMLVEGLEVWARYEQSEAIGPTDPAWITQAASRGRGIAAGVNYYFNSHFFKLQLDWAHSFGDDLGRGPHDVRLQLDASF